MHRDVVKKKKNIGTENKALMQAATNLGNALTIMTISGQQTGS